MSSEKSPSRFTWQMRSKMWLILTSTPTIAFWIRDAYKWVYNADLGGCFVRVRSDYETEPLFLHEKMWLGELLFLFLDARLSSQRYGSFFLFSNKLLGCSLFLDNQPLLPFFEQQSVKRMNLRKGLPLFSISTTSKQGADLEYLLFREKGTCLRLRERFEPFSPFNQRVLSHSRNFIHFLRGFS